MLHDDEDEFDRYNNITWTVFELYHKMRFHKNKVDNNSTTFDSPTYFESKKSAKLEPFSNYSSKERTAPRLQIDTLMGSL